MAGEREESVSPWSAGLRGLCPSCGEASMFDGFLALKTRCPVCGLDYGFADTADGPAFFIMSIVGVIVAASALIVEALHQPPYWLHALLWGPLTLALCLAMLRPFKGVLLALQYHHKAEEGRLSGK